MIIGCLNGLLYKQFERSGVQIGHPGFKTIFCDAQISLYLLCCKQLFAVVAPTFYLSNYIVDIECATTAQNSREMNWVEKMCQFLVLVLLYKFIS